MSKNYFTFDPEIEAGLLHPAVLLCRSKTEQGKVVIVHNIDYGNERITLETDDIALAAIVAQETADALGLFLYAEQHPSIMEHFL